MLKQIDEVALAQVINTRLFHDLSGTICAIHNCIELVYETANQKNLSEECVSQILHSESRHLVNKINFYRIAYGIANARVIEIGFLKTLLDNFVSHKNIEFICSFNKNIVSISYNLAQILMTITELLSDYVDYKVNINADNIHHIVIEVTLAEQSVYDASYIYKNITFPVNADIEVDNCKQYYINVLLKNECYDMKVDMNQNNIVLQLTKI